METLSPTIFISEGEHLNIKHRVPTVFKQNGRGKNELGGCSTSPQLSVDVPHETFLPLSKICGYLLDAGVHMHIGVPATELVQQGTQVLCYSHLHLSFTTPSLRVKSV
jgi:hypothetical protein